MGLFAGSVNSRCCLSSQLIMLSAVTVDCQLFFVTTWDYRHLHTTNTPVYSDAWFNNEMNRVWAIRYNWICREYPIKSFSYSDYNHGKIHHHGTIIIMVRWKNYMNTNIGALIQIWWQKRMYYYLPPFLGVFPKTLCFETREVLWDNASIPPLIIYSFHV